LLGGHITLYLSGADPSILEGGQARVLLYMTPDKIPGFDAPTTVELYNFRTPNFMGVWGSKGIPEYIEALAKVFFCGSTSSPRTEKLNNFNLSPFTLSLSKGKLRTFARSSIVNKLEEAFTKALKEPSVTSVMKRLSLPIVYMNRSDMTSYIEKMFRETKETLTKLEKLEAEEEAQEKK